MKILWLSHLIPYPPKGGVLQRSYNLIKELSKDNEVDLVAFNQVNLLKHIYPSMSEAIKDATQELSKYCKAIHFFDIPCDTTSYGKKLLAFKSIFTFDPYTVNWLKSKEMEQFIQKLSLSHKYDLIHFDTLSLIPYKKYFSSDVCILDHHNIESHMMFRRASTETHFLKKIYFHQEALKLQRYEKKYCPKFNLHITCSHLDSKRLQEIISEKNVVDIPNGVDVDYFKPDPTVTKTPCSLIFTGGLDWYPNKKAILFFIREVWPTLRKKVTNITVNIIGKNPPEELINLSKNDTRIQLHGFVNDIRDYMNTAQVYVCPIDDGGGTKLKILDALAMSKSIVSNPIACEGIDVTNSKDVLFAEMPDEYVDKIMYLFSNPSESERIGQNSRKLIESKYSYDIIGGDFRKLYKDLLTNSNKP
ncbi:FIG137776: Glycosyltransferase [hydrothermal vent metagenome]|uniref:FIG137776: Glycosyltransferase n=1 Tax=hydrothermal vent metagenome TaxID=652676 RepID=A0A3B0ZZF2_9ZZZZ